MAVPGPRVADSYILIKLMHKDLILTLKMIVYDDETCLVMRVTYLIVAIMARECC